MAHITLSIPDEMYKEIKMHPHIKWSEAARQGIKQQLFHLKGVVSGKEIIESLSHETKQALERISNLPQETWRKHYKKMKESEKRRLKSLTRVS